MKAKTKLLPCPFCGGESYVNTWWPGSGGVREWSAVRCTKCGASAREWRTKSKAIAAWNLRPAPSRANRRKK
jgi:Lar family restriction alleviation protein